MRAATRWAQVGAAVAEPPVGGAGGVAVGPAALVAALGPVPPEAPPEAVPGGVLGGTAAEADVVLDPCESSPPVVHAAARATARTAAASGTGRARGVGEVAEVTAGTYLGQPGRPASATVGSGHD